MKPFRGRKIGFGCNLESWRRKAVSWRLQNEYCMPNFGVRLGARRQNLEVTVEARATKVMCPEKRCELKKIAWRSLVLVRFTNSNIAKDK